MTSTEGWRPRDRADLIDAIRTEGRRRRARRRRLLTGTAAVAAVAVTIPLVALALDDSDGRRLRTVDQPGVTTFTTPVAPVTTHDSSPPTTSKPEPPPYYGHRVVYRRGETDVYWSKHDGSDERLFFSRSKPVTDMTWSADGRWMAYTEDGRSVNLADRELRQNGPVTPSSEVMVGPDFSEDGTLLAMSRKTAEGWELGYIRLTEPGRPFHQIRVNGIVAGPDGFNPSWVPGPPRALLVEGRAPADGVTRVYHVEMEDGRTWRATAEDGEPETSPDHAPARNLLVFARTSGLWQVESYRSGRPSPLFKGVIEDPTYAPAGDRLLFNELVGGEWQVRITGTDGRGEERVARGARDPAWVPLAT